MAPLMAMSARIRVSFVTIVRQMQNVPLRNLKDVISMVAQLNSSSLSVMTGIMVMMENDHALDLAHHHHVDPVLAQDRALQLASAVVRDHAHHDQNPAHAADHPKSHDHEAAPDLDQLIISDADRALDHDLRSIWTTRITTMKKRKSHTQTDSKNSPEPHFPNKLR